MSVRRRNARGITTATILLTLAAPFSVLAGDVTVSVSGGTLKLKGGADADDVAIDNRGALAVGEVRVTPGLGTTVNGAPGEQIFGGFTAGIKAALGDGADVFTVDDMPVPGALTVAAGKGSDRVRLLFATIAGKAKIDLGAGTNALEVCGSSFAASLVVKAGAPVVGLASAQCPGSTADPSTTPFGSVGLLEDVDVLGDLSLKGGKGFDGFGVRGATIVGNAKIALGAGANAFATCDADYQGNLTIGMGGKDEAAFQVTCEGTDFTAAATGNAAVAMADVSLAGTLKVKTGKGGDGVVIIDVSMASAKIDVGAGVNFFGLFTVGVDGDLSAKSGKHSDTLALDDFGAMGDVKLALGAGDNELTTDDSGVDGDFTVKAGKGNDTLNTTGVVVGGTRDVDGGGGMDTITP